MSQPAGIAVAPDRLIYACSPPTSGAPAQVTVIDPSGPPDGNHRPLASGGSLQAPTGIAFFPLASDIARRVRVKRLARSGPFRQPDGSRLLFDVLQVRNTGSIPGPVTLALDGCPRACRCSDRMASRTTPRLPEARFTSSTSGRTASSRPARRA